MTYSAEVLADSPLAYYRHGEPSGATLVDSSGNSRDGTYTVGPTLGATGLIADADTCADYQGGAGGYATITSASWMNVSTLVVEAWIKPDQVTSQATVIIRDDTGATRDWILRILSNGRIDWIVWNSSGTLFQCNPSTVLTAGSTYHVVCIFDGTNMKVYLNGVQIGTSTSVSGTVRALSQPIQIAGSGNRYDGKIDEVALYTSLTPTRIGVHYTTGLGGGTTVNVGLASETDTALSITAKAGAVVSLGQPTETDTALAITAKAGAVVSLGQPSETDTALPIATTLKIPIGLASETDTALPITAIVAGELGLASETDTALPITSTAGAAVPIGIASETDTALAISYTVGAIVIVGLATETDTALPVSALAPTVVGIATETDTALAIARIVVTYSTDTTNLASGRIRSGYAVATWSPPVAAPEAFPLMVHDFDKAQAYETPTVVDGRVIPFNPTETATPRHRDRILVGGKDVTYFRGSPTPTPAYRLVSPGLYGAGQLVMPQVNALYEAVGTGALSFLKKGKTVKVQRVDPDTGEVLDEDYVGFITGRPVSGSASTFPLGGELVGRMALAGPHPLPVFKAVMEAGLLLFDTINKWSVRPVRPRLGEVTGIRLPKAGGMDVLERFNQLVAQMTHKNGDQWTVDLRDDGAWGMKLKDRTTVHATIYFDDARMVPELDNDMAEEPNRIYATGVDRDGRKIFFRKYPGLKQGEAPSYPMDDNSSFGVGTVDADTDTGSGVTSMINRLIVMNFLSRAEGDYVFDADVTEAIEALQDKAGLAETGVMNPATWRALYDLSATGHTLRGARTDPAAQLSAVRPWNHTSSGAITTRNPGFQPRRVVVGKQLDMGLVRDAQQVRQFSHAELMDSDDPNWAGTVTCHYALIRGEHTPGDPIEAADVMPAREIRPGMNVWEPHFDGGTLFHVSAVEVPLGGRVPVLTLDTRARDTMKVWQVIQRNRDSRRDPARVWLSQYLSSKISKDGIGAWDPVGGVIDDRVQLTGGTWTVFECVAGQEGTLRKIRVRTNPNTEFAVAVFGKKITARRLNHLVPNPLTEAGSERWDKLWVRNVLEDRVYLESWGNFEQPCGYWPGKKTGANGPTGDPVTGNMQDDAQFSYHTFGGRGVFWVAVWAAADSVIPPGRIMWQQLEEGS